MNRAFSAFAIVLLLALIMPMQGIAQELGTPTPGPESDAPTLIFEPQNADNQNYFDIEMESGEQSTLAIKIGNGGNAPIELVTYAADGYTIRNGGFGLLDMDAEDTGVTSWLDYPDETFTLDPDETIERTFTVTVPEGTEPGEYMTGIALETANPLEDDNQEGMFRIDQFVRSVRAIRITVPGPVTPSLELGEVSLEQDGNIPALVVEVANTGNVLLAPAGKIEVTGSDGTLILSAPVQMGPVYAGNTTAIWLGLAEPLPEGEYRVSVALSDTTQDVTATLDDAELNVTAPASPAPPPPIAIASSSIEPGPDADNVQFAVVDATITNIGEPVGNAQLSLLVFKDGEEVERFPISQALSLQQGDTSVNTRYIPLEGWSPGEWTFELLLETVEGNGAAAVVASQPIEGSITIP